MLDKKQLFIDYLSRQGLKSTRQREIILDEFLRYGSHPSTEELFLRLRKKHSGIGYATVHRTLKLFSDCGIAESRDFGDGQTRYESTTGEEHHDHLICKGCGKIVEFEDPHIEELQAQIARKYGFLLLSHRHEIFGLCAACQEKES